jgi:hypothetical protein
MKILTGKQIAIWSFVMTALVELFTVILRFGFRLESTRETAATVGVLTHGIRIHHGTVGLLVVILALICFKVQPAASRWMLVVGMALICSDLIHHFVVLWLIVGSPEFDIAY